MGIRTKRQQARRRAERVALRSVLLAGQPKQGTSTAMRVDEPKQKGEAA